MESTWFLAATWLGLALLATWLRISTALSIVRLRGLRLLRGRMAFRVSWRAGRAPDPVVH